MIDVVANLLDEDLGAHTCVVLTYGLDLALYDGYVRRKLRAAGVSNQLVFCDHGQYVAALDAVPVLRYFGSGYSVTPVVRPGAFHPKMYLLLGRERGRLVVGSGNATTGGLLRNAEVFGTFEFDAATAAGPHPALVQAAGYVDELLGEATPVARRQWERARAWTPWLAGAGSGDGRALLLADRGRPPLLDQLRASIGDAPIASAVAVSASFDRDLAGLRALAELCASPPRCVVDAERANLNGEAVERLGGRVAWRAFEDLRKGARSDAALHAKLYVFEREADEVVVYGSANASRPAWLGGPRANGEAVVVMPPRSIGTTTKALGLDDVLAGPDITAQLAECAWRSEEDEGPGERAPVTLVGVSCEANTFQVTVVGAADGAAFLALAATVGRSPLLRLDLERESGRILARAAGSFEAAQVAWLLDAAGKPVSEAVGITWPSVVASSSAPGLGGRVEAALFALQNGEVLGTIIHDLLSQIEDPEMLLAHRSGAGGQRSSEEAGGDEGSDEEALPADPSDFYTDATRAHTATSWSGDRTDLDLLATLVQPMNRPARRTTDEDDVDDSVVSEEAERRRINETGRATGDERHQAGVTATRPALERAKRRLVRRLERAAHALEESVPRPDDAADLNPRALSRQVSMLILAAFLCGQVAKDSAGDEMVCLDPVDFARYALRFARVLAAGGGRAAGARSFLGRLPSGAWEGHDGESLRRALAFVWTCALWAGAFVRAQQARPRHAFDGDLLVERVPELVVARLVATLAPHCERRDEHDLTRRFPAWHGVDARALGAFEDRVTSIAAVLRAQDAAPPEVSAQTPLPAALRPGEFVYSRATGLTVFLQTSSHGRADLLDLASFDRDIRHFQTGVARAEGAGLAPLQVHPPSRGWLPV